MHCVQGLLFSGPDCVKTHTDIVRLWMHETERVYKDKLVDTEDVILFDKLVKEIVKKVFEVGKGDCWLI